MGESSVQPQMHLTHPLFLFAFFSNFHGSYSQSSLVTVPISDTTNIVRSGNGWKDNEPVPTSETNALCGSWTREVGDSVTFKFTGTTVSVKGDIVYPGLTQATLDGVILTPYNEVPNIVCNEVLFSATNLDPIEHTLIVTAAKSIGGYSPVLAIQSVSYTAADPIDLIVSSLSSSSSSTSTNSASTTSDSLTLSSISGSGSTGASSTSLSQTTSLSSTSASDSAASSSSNSQAKSLSSTTGSSSSTKSSTAGADVASASASSGDTIAQPEVRVGGTSRNGGKIAGGVVGAAASILLLLIALFQGHDIAYFFSSLGFLLFGWWLFRGRIFVFLPERKIGPVEITIFLSNKEVISDTPSESPQVMLAWQVIKIGYSRRSFKVSCPCLKGTGETRLGFGDVDDIGTAVRSNLAAPAPTCWNGSEFEEYKPDESEASYVGLAFKNNQESSADVTLGTHEEIKNREVFLPFLRIRNVPSGRIYTADHNLYLHAFVTHGYEAGKYDDELVGAIREDTLTERGIKVADLKPRSHWYITKKPNGKLKLKVKGFLKDKEKDEEDEKAYLMA